jgi:ABC-type lipoprotein release transport system permease subunit
MNDSIVVAILSLVGTLIGTLSGIMTANKLTTYRIQELEKKVDKHNNFADRIPVIEEQVKVINHRIDDLENYHK